MTSLPPDFIPPEGTDRLQASGSLGLLDGVAGLEVLPSVLTEPPDTSVIGFGTGSARIYDLGPLDLGPISGALDVAIDGGVVLLVGGDLASVSDFAFYPATENDPAMALAVADNNGTVSGHVGAAWTRHHMTFYAPTDNPAWQRAAYAAFGLLYKAVPASGIQHLDDAQVEIAPIAANAPLAYSPARSIDVRVRPTRLNYATNPSFEGVSLVEWNITGTADLAAAADSNALYGANVAHVTDAGSGDLLSLGVRGLTPGLPHTASIYVYSRDGGDIGLEVQGTSDSPDGIAIAPMTWQSAEAIDETRPMWRRLWVSFTAESTIAFLRLQVFTSVVFDLDGVLVEEGNGVRSYFDGSFGIAEYFWEDGGTPGQARSYYYRNRSERHYALSKTLRENVSQGIFVGDPEYATSAISVPNPYGSGPYGSGPYGG